MSLYQTCLRAVATLPRSTDILREFEDLICAGFHRSTVQEIGPVSFMSFWKETYMTRRDIQATCPAGLAALLRSLSDRWAFHTLGLTHDTGIQTDQVAFQLSLDMNCLSVAKPAPIFKIPLQLSAFRSTPPDAFSAPHRLYDAIPDTPKTSEFSSSSDGEHVVSMKVSPILYRERSDISRKRLCVSNGGAITHAKLNQSSRSLVDNCINTKRSHTVVHDGSRKQSKINETDRINHLI